MRRLLAKPENLVFALLCAVCVTILNLPGQEQVGLARRVNRAFLLPVLLVQDDVRGYLGLRDENRRLREDLERRALDVSELSWTRVENLRLREALGFRSRLPVRLVAAEVIATSDERAPRAFLIDRGSKDGIRPNLPVVTPDGLVGKTAETDGGASLVLTLRHPDFRASAIALAAGEAEAGIAAATPGGELELIVPMRSSASPGDPVITSGIGPVFPRGIPIGRISRVAQEDRLKLQKNDRIDPGVDLARVTSVFVLLQDAGPADDPGAGGADVPGGASALFWPGFEAPPALAGGASDTDSLAAAGDAAAQP